MKCFAISLFILFFTLPEITAQIKPQKNLLDLTDYLVDQAHEFLGKTEFQILSIEDTLRNTIPMNKKTFNMHVIKPNLVDSAKVVFVSDGRYSFWLYFGTAIERVWAIRIMTNEMKISELRKYFEVKHSCEFDEFGVTKKSNCYLNLRDLGEDICYKILLRRDEKIMASWITIFLVGDNGEIPYNK